jgi:hypothetical protein
MSNHPSRIGSPPTFSMSYREGARITVTYHLKPPNDVNPPKLGDESLSPVVRHIFPPDAKATNSTTHYALLLESINNAKERLGEELTVWRDAVGEGEKHKVVGAKKVKVASEDEDDEDDEEEV